MKKQGSKQDAAEITGIEAENRLMVEAIERTGRRLEDIRECRSPDPDVENSLLRDMLLWMKAYGEFHNRREMEKRGFHFPPIDPDFDPDTDWLRFERWMRGEPLSWRFTELFGPVRAPEELDDAQVERELERVEGLLERRAITLDAQRDVPPRLLLAYLRRTLSETDFEVAAPGVMTHLDGCHGFCPECFQRPWCDCGMGDPWPEDEEAGRYLVPVETAPYCSPVPLSRKGLRKAG
jgi:hypothetical protein